MILSNAKKTIENNVKNDRLEVSFSTKNDLECTTPFVENERTFRFFVLALFGTNGGTFSKSNSRPNPKSFEPDQAKSCSYFYLYIDNKV